MASKRIDRREFIGRSGLSILSAGLGVPLLTTSCSRSAGILTRTFGEQVWKSPSSATE